jgi:hypothetical protein
MVKKNKSQLEQDIITLEYFQRIEELQEKLRTEVHALFLYKARLSYEGFLTRTGHNDLDTHIKLSIEEELNELKAERIKYAKAMKKILQIHN